MDTRIALEKGTLLQVKRQDESFVEFKIRREIGRGAGCIVYDAVYRDHAAQLHAVRVKECYPFGLEIRREGQALLAEDETAFAACQERLRQSARLHNRLFHTKGLTNSVVNMLEFYEANHTLYLVMAYAEGVSLTEVRGMSLKEKVTVAQSAAVAIGKLHAEGWLYLDLKPENLFVLEETKELVQLYDFDSLLPINFLRENKEAESFRLSCTREFAAPELRFGDLRRIGKQTDVYAVGALLFELIFGRTPEAPDCRREAAYAFDRFCLAGDTYSDQVYPALTEFFHRTLADYPGDRYPDMAETAEALGALRRLSDPETPFIHSVRPTGEELLFGRQEELHTLERWFEREDSRCLFVTGIGGIGKSALVRGYLAAHEAEFDTVLYLYCTASVPELIADDSLVIVHTLERQREESVRDYFLRKLRRMKELSAGRRLVLVLDDFEDELDEDLRRILDGDWKVLILTRRERLSEGYETLKLDRIRDRKSLYELFAAYSGQSAIHASGYLDRIIDRVEGYTLALELIAKQVAASYLTIQSAAELMEAHGFSGMAPESVSCRRDQTTANGQIGSVLAALFHRERLTGQEETLLKTLALFDMPGIEEELFSGMLALKSKDGINRLRESGWIEYAAPYLRMHPVIREIAAEISWNSESRAAACSVAEELLIRLNRRTVTARNLALAEQTIRACGRDETLAGSAVVGDLLYVTLLRAPREHEDCILTFAKRLLADPAGREPEELLKIYDRAISIYDERGDFPAARGMLRQAKRYLSEVRADHRRRTAEEYCLWAGYADLLADYYDARLSGSYDEGSRNPDFRKLLAAVRYAKSSVKKARRAGLTGGGQALARYLLSELTLRIRSYPVNDPAAGMMERKRIDRLIREYRELTDREPYVLTPELLAGGQIMYAWYATWVRPDFQNACRHMREAEKIAKKAAAEQEISLLDYLDQAVVSCANICLEWRQYEQALAWLKKGLAICGQKEELEPFRRKKEELNSHIRDVRAEMARK